MEQLKTLVSRVEVWPTGLVSASVLAEEMGLSEQRILQLADAGYWPHYRLDGGAPLFKKSESREWAAKNLMQRFAAAEPTLEFKVMLSATGTVRSMPPTALHGLQNLTELTHFLQPPGVYFLCLADEVVYVGQSIKPVTRVETHRADKNKQFDRVYFIPVPEFLLNAVEREFIAYFRPRFNGDAGPAHDARHAQVAKQVLAQLSSLSPCSEERI